MRRLARPAIVLAWSEGSKLVAFLIAQARLHALEAACGRGPRKLELAARGVAA